MQQEFSEAFVKRAEEFYGLIAQFEPISERQLADRAGLKKSPYTRSLLAALAGAGTIRRVDGMCGNRACHLYVIARREDAQ